MSGKSSHEFVARIGVSVQSKEDGANPSDSPIVVGELIPKDGLSDIVLCLIAGWWATAVGAANHEESDRQRQQRGCQQATREP
jgi:hypothetical protein